MEAILFASVSGNSPLKAETGVRFPLGAPKLKKRFDNAELLLRIGKP